MAPKASETGKTVSIVKVSKIVKRNGRVADFDPEKITSAIMKAARAVGGNDRKEAERLTRRVTDYVAKIEKLPSVEEIQDAVEKILMEEGHAKTAKAYILYRAKRAELRQAAAEAAKGTDGEKTALLDMFAHKSKLASIIGYDRIEAYKHLLINGAVVLFDDTNAMEGEVLRYVNELPYDKIVDDRLHPSCGYAGIIYKVDA